MALPPPLYLFVRDRLAKADVVYVDDRNQDGGVIRDDAEMEETERLTKNGFLFDPFNDTEPVVRVDDLVADLECHVSPVAGRLVGPVSCREQHL